MEASSSSSLSCSSLLEELELELVSTCFLPFIFLSSSHVRALLLLDEVAA